MSHSIEVEGTIWGVFAHRFAIETRTGKVLADLGPHSVDRITLKEGDRVRLSGERKRSEIKVETLVAPDGTTHRIDWPSKEAPPPADPAVAVRAVEAEGYRVEGEPQRKPKHWEIAASREGRSYELHVALDGHLRKVKELAA